MESTNISNYQILDTVILQHIADAVSLGDNSFIYCVFWKLAVVLMSKDLLGILYTLQKPLYGV